MGTSNSPRISKINIIQKWTELSEKEMRTARKSARREFWLEWKFHFQQKWSSNINYNFRCLQKYYLIYFIYFTFIFNEFIYVKLYFPRGGRKWSILAVQSELKPFLYPFLKNYILIIWVSAFKPPKIAFWQSGCEEIPFSTFLLLVANLQTLLPLPLITPATNDDL